MAKLEYTVRAHIGKVYAENHFGRALIGEGVGAIEALARELVVEPARVDAFIEEFNKHFPEPDCPIDIVVRVDDGFDFGDREVQVYNTHTFRIDDVKLPELIDCSVVMERPEVPPPPYRPKLLAYDKRRNYSKKGGWNRIRSRLS
jgi:hypothetical protein